MPTEDNRPFDLDDMFRHYERQRRDALRRDRIVRGCLVLAVILILIGLFIVSGMGLMTE